MKPSISVVIPTLGRNKELVDTLHGLLKQTVPPLEIVVIDQNTPPFVEVVEFARQHPLIRHITGLSKGYVLNCNRCLDEARGDIILYVDDDVIPDSKLIERHLANYTEARKKGERLGGVAGRIRTPNHPAPPSTSSKIGHYDHVLGKVTANFDSSLRKEVQFGQGCNVSFDRQILKEVGGFDMIYDGNGYFADTDAGLKVVRAGYKIIYDPSAVLDHLMASSGGVRVPDKAQHTYYFIKNGVRLYRRHSSKLGLPFFLLQMGAYSAAKAAYNRNPRILWKGLQALKETLAN